MSIPIILQFTTPWSRPTAVSLLTAVHFDQLPLPATQVLKKLLRTVAKAPHVSYIFVLDVEFNKW